MNARPNILFLFADDQRYDTLAAGGNEEIITPNLDKLAASGTVFMNAHIPGGTCPAVCMPSRAMLHTGRTLFHVRDDGKDIPPEHRTMGETFREAGYAVCGVGKWHNGRQAFARSFTCGDEIFFGGMDDHWNVPVYHFDPSGRYEEKLPFVPDPFHSNALNFRHCDHIAAGVHSSDLFAEAACRFLKERGSEEPFFMYVSFMAPHDPRTMPERFRRMYAEQAVRLPPNFMPKHPLDTGALNVRDELLAGFPRAPAEIRRHIAEYYAMISHLDAAIGRILHAAEETGCLGNTIVVFSADNGLAVGRHGLMGKQNLYDHSVRVPLLFSGPGIPRGVRIGELVYLSDVFPTLCALAGLSAPRSVEGRNLASCFRGAAQTRLHNALYLAYGSSIRGLKTGRYKLIEYACGGAQLFDLSADPHEMQNLAAEESYAPLVRDMRSALLASARQWDDETHPAGMEFWKHRADIKKAAEDG